MAMKSRVRIESKRTVVAASWAGVVMRVR